ncbi:hypothetical protein [Nesterenkonia rhizosphaerae]|uniref:Holliday junction resolvase n=1 Tax=Nesterenkonia rhizosphaerae TaxID=1348272 RepID=A0ABP9G0W2_9MICC
MPNRQKAKGDRFEWKAIRFLQAQPGAELIDVATPGRLLGAGRKDDGGDLHLYTDVAVQVKAYANLGAAVRESAYTSQTQASYANKPLGVGMVPVPRAREGSVQWIFTTPPDAVPAPTVEPKATFARISDLVAWITDDTGPKGYRPYPRINRAGLLAQGSSQPVLCMTAEVWLESLAEYRNSTRPQ